VVFAEQRAMRLERRAERGFRVGVAADRRLGGAKVVDEVGDSQRLRSENLPPELDTLALQRLGLRVRVHLTENNREIVQQRDRNRVSAPTRGRKRGKRLGEAILCPLVVPAPVVVAAERRQVLADQRMIRSERGAADVERTQEERLGLLDVAPVHNRSHGGEHAGRPLVVLAVDASMAVE
jgi:hypothetical protein